MSAGSKVLGEVADEPALSPSQAAIDLKLAQEAFLDAIGKWRDYTAREIGELAEKWWHCLRALSDSIGAS